MKRIHLFEFEDIPWFPNWLRVRMTRLINVMHKILGTSDQLAEILDRALKSSGTNTIVDLCSGSGGPMPSVYNKLKSKYNHNDIELHLSDLYPDMAAARKINESEDGISYEINPVNATTVENLGLRTMVGSFHHMRPKDATKILKSAQEANQPFCLFEISDNSIPIILWWLAIPVNFIMCLFITPMVRPMSWQQLVFTYIIPIIPLFFAWDGAVSNARTYTHEDMDQLLGDIGKTNYKWEKGIIPGKAKKLYLLGLPNSVDSI